MTNETRLTKQAPTKPLAEYVSHLWIARRSKDGECIERFIPNGQFELIIDIGEVVEQGDYVADLHPRPRALLGGLYNRHFFVRPKGNVHTIGVLFKSCGLQPFTRIPDGELDSRILALEDIFGSAACDLQDQLWNSHSDDARMSILQEFLQRRFDSNHVSPSSIRGAIEMIKRSGGNVRVKELASHLNMSERHLRRLFRTYLGHSPKELSRIVRLDQLIRRRRADASGSLTKTSLEAGYFDQAHFIREFTDIVGVSPSSFFTDAHPFADIYIR